MSATLGVVCPANVERPSTGGDPVAITYSTPVPSGGSAPVSVTCQPASGTEFAPGSTPVTCTAQDSGGRQATCSFSITVNVVAQLRVTRFLVFGDSLSEGKVSLLPTFLVDSPSHSYPFKLEAMLKARYTGQDVIVLNEGRGGERASESYGRFQEVLDLHQPDAVLLMHGMNDLIGGRLAEVQDAADGVEELVKEAMRAGLPTIVATLPHLGTGPKASCPECIDPFNDLIRAMVAAKGALLADVQSAWGSRSELMGADGIHPTEAGYEAIAEAFFNVIRQHFETGGATPD